MNSKLIMVRKDKQILTALIEDSKICEFSCQDEEGATLLGNIYIGRVKNIVKNINAAFIEIEKGVPCYYPLDDCEAPIYTKKIPSPNMVAGDEVLVQVSREALKTKPPALTTNLNFTGKYLVLTTGKNHVGVSAKLEAEDRSRLKELVSPLADEHHGFIVRTNAGEASDEEILKEAEYLLSTCDSITSKAKYRSCFSLMYQNTPSWMAFLRDTHTKGLSILTDDDLIYAKMKAYLEIRQPEDLPRLNFYEDPLLPLAKLYNLEGELRNALRERVWLKSGAYLIIQPTEALTVIDVNTGKYEGHKKKQDTFLKINLEAAQEIARQLRLRNLSGIILVDFINMKAKEAREELMEKLDAWLHKDPIKTVLVDMTALNLVEITRKKMRRPLSEQIKLEADL